MQAQLESPPHRQLSRFVTSLSALTGTLHQWQSASPTCALLGVRVEARGPSQPALYCIFNRGLP